MFTLALCKKEAMWSVWHIYIDVLPLIVKCGSQYMEKMSKKHKAAH